MNRGYTLLWRKIRSNSLLREPGRKFSRLEAWLYVVNVLAAGKDDEKTGLRRGGSSPVLAASPTNGTGPAPRSRDSSRTWKRRT